MVDDPYCDNNVKARGPQPNINWGGAIGCKVRPPPEWILPFCHTSDKHFESKRCNFLTIHHIHPLLFPIDVSKISLKARRPRSPLRLSYMSLLRGLSASVFLVRALSLSLCPHCKRRRKIFVVALTICYQRLPIDRLVLRIYVHFLYLSLFSCDYECDCSARPGCSRRKDTGWGLEEVELELVVVDNNKLTHTH